MTRVPYDHAAKALLQEALGSLGTARVQHEIAGSEPQWVDVWFEPAETGMPGPGLRGAMARTRALFEAYRNPPGIEDIYACLRKQLALARGPTVAPILWVMSAGRPDGALAALAMRQREGWPSVVYAMTCEAGIPCFVVVLAELPEERGTLLLRLMGAGPTLRQAVRDARGLTEDAWEHPAAVAAITVLRSRLETLEPRDEELAMEINETYDQWKARVTREARDQAEREGRARGMEQGIERGLERGIEQGRCAVVLTLLTKRFGEIDARTEARVRTASHAQLERILDRLLTAPALDDVLE